MQMFTMACYMGQLELIKIYGVIRRSALTGSFALFSKIVFDITFG